MARDIEIRWVRLFELNKSRFKKFKRYQKTSKVVYINDNEVYTKDDCFVDDWDEQKKKQLLVYLQNAFKHGAIVIAAYKKHDIVGFGCVENKLIGKRKEYLEFSYLHISYKYRNKGIGKRIFLMCCDSAKKIGAKKIYIGAHPSIETQSFYKSLGCELASEIINEIYEKEPLDIQLEYKL